MTINQVPTVKFGRLVWTCFRGEAVLMDQERKLQALDIVVTAVLFITACILGKISMNHFGDTWIAFNGPALGSLAVGVLWTVIRKRLIKKWEGKNE